MAYNYGYTLEELIARKGYVGLVCYIPKDGRPFEEETYNPKSKFKHSLSHNSVSYELQKSIESIVGYGGISFPWIVNEEPDAWEVIVRVKKGTKLYEAYNKLGFGEI